MRDVDLYQQILGINAPWRVARVELGLEERRVSVFVEHHEGATFVCPECGSGCPLHDHGEERTWRHLDTCQYMTLLHARPPRVRCGLHGVKQVELPWADPKSRFTLMFERFAIDLLRETSVAAGAKLLGIGWDQAFGIMKRAVQRGLRRRKPTPIPRLGVDEKRVMRGRFMTIASDLAGRVLWLGDGRKKETLDLFFDSLTLQQKESIEAVAMDMWQPYFASVVEHVPDAKAKVVFDRFHIQKHMNEAVDRVRRNEHYALAREGNDVLSKTRHIWLWGRENVPEKYTERFGALRRITLRTGKAWAIKEDLRWFWAQRDKEAAVRFIKRWMRWAKRSTLRPVIRVANMVKNHLANLLTYFDHPITSAACEGVNAAIERIHQRAAGYRNVEHFKTAVLFHRGGLDLYPARSTH